LIIPVRPRVVERVSDAFDGKLDLASLEGPNERYSLQHHHKHARLSLSTYPAPMITGYHLSPDGVALAYPPTPSLPLLSFLKAQRECKAKTEAFDSRLRALEDHLEPRFCHCCGGDRWEKEAVNLINAYNDLETSLGAAWVWSRAFFESENIHNQDAAFHALYACRHGIVHSIQKEMSKAFNLYHGFPERMLRLTDLLKQQLKGQE
jgi:hypothetical protein